MGASWSSKRSEQPSHSVADLEQPPDPTSQSKYPCCYGDVVPSVCGDRSEDFYDELYEKIYFVQHKNKDSIVVFQHCEKDNPCVDPEEWYILAERIPRVYKYLAHSINTPDVDLDRPIDLHPRIVKYLGPLPVGYLLEKLDPGPLASTTLPLLTTFPTSRTSPGDQDSPTNNGDREPLLLLYYRWALQSLAMLAFLHEQGVYLMDFSSRTIWIREDLSIALSGFVNATIPTDEWPYSPDGTRYEAEIFYPTVPGNGFPELTPKIDLSDWATFVWQLMRTDATSGAKRWALPTDPLDETEVPGEENPWEYHTERLKEGRLQLLEEERLEPMLVKAWKGEYENAREIMQEVRSYLEQIGVRMEGEDEVLLDGGRKWEDLFSPPVVLRRTRTGVFLSNLLRNLALVNDETPLVT